MNIFAIYIHTYWEKAYYISIFNNLSLLAFSIFNYNYEFSSTIQLLILLIYCFLSIISFFYFLLSNAFMSPITWATLGFTLFIGLGSIASLFGESFLGYLFYDENHLIEIKFVYILNSLSISIIYIISYFITINHKIKSKISLKEHFLKFSNDSSIFNIMALIVVFLIMKIIYLSNIDNLVFSSLIQKLTYIESGLVSFLVVRFIKANIKLKLVTIFFIIIEILISITLLSKFHVIKILLSFIIGLLIYRKSLINLISGGMISLIIFILLTPIINATRLHNIFVDHLYNGKQFTLKDRSNIMLDSFNKVYLKNKIEKDSDIEFYKSFLVGKAYRFNEIGYRISDAKFDLIIKDIISHKNNKNDILKLKKKYKYTFDIGFTNEDINSNNQLSSNNWLKRLKYYLVRFDIVSIQRYLMSQYDKGLKGETLNKFWYVFVPRFFWNEKPIMTDHGVALHNNYYNYYKYLKSKKKKFYHDQKSALAPGYFSEGYWNYGWFGLVLVCTFMGLLIGYLNKISMFYKNNNEAVSYGLVSISIITWSAKIEGWLIGSIIGEIVIIMILYYVIKVFLMLKSRILNIIKIR